MIPEALENAGIIFQFKKFIWKRNQRIAHAWFVRFIQPAKLGPIYISKKKAEVILQFQSFPRQLIGIIFS